MRVLFAYRSGDVDVKGGAATVMHRTAEALQRLGTDVEISHDIDPDPAGFDVVHPINVWSPGTALEQLRHLRERNATVVWQPFYLGYSEQTWARAAVFGIFGQGRPADEQEQLLGAFTTGELEVNGMRRFARNEPIPGFYPAMKEMLDLVDRVVVISMREAQMISNDVGLRGKPFTHTPHGVEATRFHGASPGEFRAHAGIGDGPFALCVGAIDPRKNQAILAHALRDASIPLVLLGPALEPDYLELVRRAGGDNIIHVERVAPELVASAYAGASAHVLASWAEGAALANLEAAAAGCPLIVSDRSSEFEYFGELARYVDPADPATIRAAVEDALDARHVESDRVAELQKHMRELTWDRTAEATIVAYEAAVADTAGRGGAGAAARPARPPVSDRLRQFTDGLPWVRRPIVDFVQDVADELEPGARVIDVGPGDSPYRELFARCDYVTSDWTPSAGPARDLSADYESFDAVVCTEVLEHTPNPGELFAELHRILKPGGRLFATTRFAWELHELPFDFCRYTPWGLHQLATEAGFGPVAVDSRNDTFATLAQLMADITAKIGPYPDGHDAERAAAAAELRGMADRVARLGRLDARWAMPLGYALRGWKAPLPARDKGTPIDGARTFATLAYAGELLLDPKLLHSYGEAFSGDDDATLVIYAPHSDAAELEPRLLQLMAEAGMSGDGAADLLALPYTGTAPDEADLAAGVDAVLSLNPPRGDFWPLPHFHQETASDLRLLAG